MCEFKGVLILKDEIFCPDYDSHEKMLSELGIGDTKENAESKFVRAALCPKDGDIFSDINKWEFIVEQDIKPEWFVAEYEKTRVIKAVKEWYSAHIHVNEDNLVIDGGNHKYIKDCTNVVIKGVAKVGCICGSSTVISIMNSNVDTITDFVKVGIIGGCSAITLINENASVVLIGDQSTITSILGKAKIKLFSGNTVVGNIGNEAEVEEFSGYAVANKVDGFAKIYYLKGNAHLFSVKWCAKVYTASENAAISYLAELACCVQLTGNTDVGYVEDKAHICIAKDYSRIKTMRGNSGIYKLEGKACIQRMYDNTEVFVAEGEAQILFMFETAHIYYLCDNASVKNFSGDAVIFLMSETALAENEKTNNNLSDYVRLTVKEGTLDTSYGRLKYDLSDDVFFVDRERKTVTCLYHNGDASSGSQFVEDIFSFDEIKEAVKCCSGKPENFFGSLYDGYLTEYLYDWNDPTGGFEDCLKRYWFEKPDYLDSTEDTAKKIMELVS